MGSDFSLEGVLSLGILVEQDVIAWEVMLAEKVVLTWEVVLSNTNRVCKIIRTFAHYHLRSYGVMPCHVCLTATAKYKRTVHLYLAVAVRHIRHGMTS